MESTAVTESKLQRNWLREFDPAKTRMQSLDNLVDITHRLWTRAGLNFLKSYGAPTKAASQLSNDSQVEEEIRLASACIVVGYMMSLFVVEEEATTPSNLEELQIALAQLIELGAEQFALFKRCATKLPARDKLSDIHSFVTFADIPIGDCWSYGVMQLQNALHKWGFNTDVRNTWITRDKLEMCVGIYIVR